MYVKLGMCKTYIYTIVFKQFSRNFLAAIKKYKSI